MMVTPDAIKAPVCGGTGSTVNTRSIPSALMVVVDAPAPVIVTLLVMFRSPVAEAVSPLPAMVSLYVPAGTMIVAPPRALAS